MSLSAIPGAPEENPRALNSSTPAEGPFNRSFPPQRRTEPRQSKGGEPGREGGSRSQNSLRQKWRHMNGHASMLNVSMKSPEKGFLLVGGDGGASFAPHPSRHHHHHHHPLNEERAESSWESERRLPFLFNYLALGVEPGKQALCLFIVSLLSSLSLTKQLSLV